MITKKSNLTKVLDFVHSKMKLRYDYFIVVTGNEGVGKSRGVFLNIADYWYRGILKKNEIPKKAVSVDINQFVNAMKDAKPLDFVGLDEAGDSMDTQEYANKINRLLYQAYTIIREKRFLTVVVLPSFFDLNPRFRKRRVRMLINVWRRVDNICKQCGKDFVEAACPFCNSTEFKKGFVCYDVYTGKQIKEILERNKYNHIKTLKVGVRPATSGIVHEYKGALTEYYTELKTKKTDDAIKELNKGVAEFNNKSVCSHQWLYRKTVKVWWCRYCGKETGENPFTEIAE